MLPSIAVAGKSNKNQIIGAKPWRYKMRISYGALAILGILMPLQTLAQSGSATSSTFVPNPEDFGIVHTTPQQPLHVPKLPAGACSPKDEPKPLPGKGYSHDDLMWFLVCRKEPKTLAPHQVKAAPQIPRQQRPDVCTGPVPAASCPKKDGFVSQDAFGQHYCDIYLEGKRGMFDTIPNSGNRPQEAINLLKQGYFASGRCVAELSAEDGNADAIVAVGMMREKHIGEGPQLEAERAKRKADAEQAQRIRQAQLEQSRQAVATFFGALLLGGSNPGASRSDSSIPDGMSWYCGKDVCGWEPQGRLHVEDAPADPQ